jgi:hypothetical protein
MNYGHTARRGKRVILSLLAALCLVVGSPVLSAYAGSGAQKPVTAGFGDCRNDNAGKHKGYVCPTPPPPVDNTDTGGDTGGGDPTGGLLF